MVPWSHLRQPFLGWVMTVLTAELTHFNLVIRLSKLQQFSLTGFPAIFWDCPAAPVVPGIPVSCSFKWSHAERQKPPFFAAALHDYTTTWHLTIGIRQAHDLQVWYSFLLVLWWGETFCASNSLELESCFMPLRHDLTTVPVQGIIARLLGS